MGVATVSISSGRNFRDPLLYLGRKSFFTRPKSDIGQLDSDVSAINSTFLCESGEVEKERY